MPKSPVGFQLHKLIEKLQYKESLRIVPFLVASLVAAFISILYTKIFFATEEFSLRILHETHWAISLIVTLVTVFLSWFLPYRFAPHASGSGIPQMLIANELDPASDSKLIRSLIGVRVICMKIIASIVCVLGGGAVGQEGPTLQIVSGIFYRLGEKSTRWIQQASTRTFILAGGASGLAAAFNTPLGGIAYALEELSKDYFNNFKTYVLWSVMATGLLVQTVLGGYLYFGFPSIQSVGVQSYFSIIGLAAITGILGAVLGKVLFRINQERKKIKNFKKLIAVNLVTGLLFWLAIYFWNEHGVGGGKVIITNLLFKEEWATASDVGVRIIGPILMSIAGVAGGLFAPTLAIGATVGSLFSELVWTHNHHLLILCGMIGFLTGFMKTPFTAFILIFEMTDRHSSLFPMMLSAAVAAGVSHMISHHSFYDLVKEDFFHKKDIDHPAN
ncbi:chloride channel protein [Bdellovibrio sp. HCB185ZH]|uniref:chloride channel protein n=1 Tax=Bdellovibrio sp. HCB185ZH TaxID=3394235 RepID=UPI0039A6681D